jgi:hypothetical protein
MTTYTTDELQERLAIIDQALASSRRGFSRYGWAFVLWGCGHLAALLWSRLQPGTWLPWPTVMVLCSVIGVLIDRQVRRRQGAVTPLGRAIGSLWLAAGLSMLVLFSCDRQQPLPMFFLLMGLVNLASGMAVRWRTQCLVAAGWLAAAAATLLDHDAQLQTVVFALMALLGEVGFGIHLVVLERGQRDHG